MKTNTVPSEMANPVAPAAIAHVAAAAEEHFDDETSAKLEPSTISFLKTCSALELSKQLIQHRFSDNLSEASAFLKVSYQHTEKAILTMAMTQASTINEACGGLLSEPLETSLLTPRMGKVQIQLSSNGFLATRLSMTNASQQQHLHLPVGSVSHLIVFPKPEDCKLIKSNNPKMITKVKGHVVLLQLGERIQFQGKDIDQVCFALPWNKNVGCIRPKFAANDESEEEKENSIPHWKLAAESWRKVLTQALIHEDMKVTQVRVDSPIFTSNIDMNKSTTTSGMPFVSCNRGVQDGVLYPLKQGLLFFKPPRFIPVSEIQEAIFGRGASAGQSSSRYVDLAIILRPQKDSGASEKDTAKFIKKNQLEEFSNILCQEEGALQEYHEEYIAPFLPKLAEIDNDNSSDNSGSEVEAQVVDTEDDDTDIDDEDFDENSMSDEDEDDGDTDDNGGIQIVDDEMMSELRNAARKRKDQSLDDTESEGSGSDNDSDETNDDGNTRSKRRVSKRPRK